MNETKLMQKIFPKSKKGGIVSDAIGCVGGIIITTVLVLVIVSTILGANLMTADSEEDNVSDRMFANFTAGIDKISAKIPTILLITAVVLLVGYLVVLWAQSKRMGIGSSGL